MDYMEVTLPNYSYVFNFEEEFKHQDTRIWMTKNWTNGFYFCGIYMILIFGGQIFMANRPRYELRGVLSLWNTLLATFSIIGFTRTAPELIHVLRNYGLYHSVCIPRFVSLWNTYTILLYNITQTSNLSYEIFFHKCAWFRDPWILCLLLKPRFHRKSSHRLCMRMQKSSACKYFLLVSSR